MPDLGYLEGTSQPAAGWQGLARPYFHPQRPFAPPPRPSLCRGRALRAPCSRHGGESVLGVTAKERKIELLMHMLSIKHETNLLL